MPMFMGHTTPKGEEYPHEDSPMNTTTVEIENRALVQQFMQMEETISRLRTDNNTLRDKVNKLTEEVRVTKHVNSSLQNRIQELSQTRTDLESKLNYAEHDLFVAKEETRSITDVFTTKIREVTEQYTRERKKLQLTLVKLRAVQEILVEYTPKFNELNRVVQQTQKAENLKKKIDKPAKEAHPKVPDTKESDDVTVDSPTEDTDEAEQTNAAEATPETDDQLKELLQSEQEARKKSETEKKNLELKVTALQKGIVKLHAALAQFGYALFEKEEKAQKISAQFSNMSDRLQASQKRCQSLELELEKKEMEIQGLHLKMKTQEELNAMKVNLISLQKKNQDECKDDTDEVERAEVDDGETQNHREEVVDRIVKNIHGIAKDEIEQAAAVTAQPQSEDDADEKPIITPTDIREVMMSEERDRKMTALNETPETN